MKSKKIFCFACILSSISLFSCGIKENASSTSMPLSSIENTTNQEERKALVAYFSCTNTTKTIAERLHQVVNSELFRILPSIPYSDEDLDYSLANSRANQEQNDPLSRPEIQNQVADISTYNTLYLGYPIWWGKAPKIIYTFLESYDFSSFTIIPFCTSGSSDIAGSESDLHALIKDANWKKGKRFARSANEEEIYNWTLSLK